VWPWDDFFTSVKVGTGAGFLFGIISAQIRPFLFDVSFGDLASFVLILAVVSLLAAFFSAAIASTIQQKKLSRVDDKSVANKNAIYVLGLSFKRMDDAEREKYRPTSPDAFVYKIPSTENYIMYEPTLGVITDYSSTLKHWLAAE
jgi:hypothetical protein